MGKSFCLIVNVLACIFSDSAKTTLSEAAKFIHGLALSTTKFLGEMRVKSGKESVSL